eukprot:TRINITY_DN4611_c0_g1_i1.p1 TRINITY_DN4611_c0_g1~~TRINITY_DN4611_c0_g1_i1.p1  ORF type:complete len:757 (+),score=170.13 TRINITY_DN4611_c0_g1_i1:206-2476(+)
MKKTTFDFDEEWEKLKEGLLLITHIMQKRTDKPLKMRAWALHYNSVYEWCTKPEDEKKRELYFKLDELFKDIVNEQTEEMKDLEGNVLLGQYLKRFGEYTSATSIIRNIFAYMEKYWIPSQITNGVTTIRYVYDLSLLDWRNNAYMQLKDKLLEALLNLVENYRLGLQVDHNLLYRMVRAYLQIGVEEEQPVIFYKTEFEEPFIKTTMDFYIAESVEFLQENNISTYMKKAEERLAQEADLAEQYLHPPTKDELKRACEIVLIERHMQMLQDEFQIMLRDDKEEDMKRFYHLLSRIVGGLDHSSSTLKSFLIEVGNEIVTDKSKNLNAKTEIKNSIRLIHELLDLHAKYTDIIEKCFSEHPLFVQAMDESFTRFINQSVGVFSMAELLNFFVDHFLKGNEKLLEDQLEIISAQTVRLFTYFDDKDLFFHSFRKSLSKRLLGRKINEDAERSFIAKLKARCGDIQTKQLEGMFTDIKVSSEQQSLFKEYVSNLENPPKVEISVTVLNDLYWPLSKQAELRLAKELLPCVEVFETYYAKRNDTRKLSWLYNQGACVVNYTFINSDKSRKRKELHISVIQTCICLLFNERSRYTFDQMIDILGLSLDMLKYALYPMMYTKLRFLANRGPDGKGKPKLPTGKVDTSINGDDIIAIMPLRSQNKRVNYPAGININMDTKESKNIRKKVQEERGVKMDLALVRVMKAKNVLSVQELQAESSKQLMKYFKPNPRLMKKRMEALMERGFLRRDDDDQRIVHYCA